MNTVNTKEKSDRFRKFAADEFAVQDLSHKLQVSVDDILSAIQEVGFNEEEIEEYLRDRYNRE